MGVVLDAASQSRRGADAIGSTMPHVQRGNAHLHYVDMGSGPAIIATHGVTENHLYWILPGIADRLVQAGYRFIATDMRAHGFTRVEGEPKGYDVETVAADFGA